ncbi:MAG: ATP-binding cassette domain-containing protein [bacterium]|nr:ATP-binding cassette domain-containing protein [bacterium]
MSDTPAPSPFIIETEDLYQWFGDGEHKKVVLDNVDLRVRPGEFVSLVGPSGCGKSTLLKILLGEDVAARFEKLTLRDLPLGPPDPSRGIVYQKYSLFPNWSVLDNVLAGPHLTNGFRKWRARKREYLDEAHRLIERAGLGGHAEQYPHQLSGGQQQRVAVLQAVMNRPAVLLMDEPFGALDPGTREGMQAFILETWKEFGLTVVFVTHDLEEACYLGTRLIALSPFYTDDRGDDPNGSFRGSRIVVDDFLRPRDTLPPLALKEKGRFNEYITTVRTRAFDPTMRQHVKDFNLRHADRFQTALPEEWQDAKSFR